MSIDNVYERAFLEGERFGRKKSEEKCLEKTKEIRQKNIKLQLDLANMETELLLLRSALKAYKLQFLIGEENENKD